MCVFLGFSWKNFPEQFRNHILFREHHGILGRLELWSYALARSSISCNAANTFQSTFSERSLPTVLFGCRMADAVSHTPSNQQTLKLNRTRCRPTNDQEWQSTSQVFTRRWVCGTNVSYSGGMDLKTASTSIPCEILIFRMIQYRTKGSIIVAIRNSDAWGPHPN